MALTGESRTSAATHREREKHGVGLTGPVRVMGQRFERADLTCWAAQKGNRVGSMRGSEGRVGCGQGGRAGQAGLGP